MRPSTRHVLGSAALLLALVFTTPAVAKPAILLFPGIGRPTQLTVFGRVLRDEPTAGSSVFSRNVRLLTAANWVGAPVEVAFGTQKLHATSGHDGIFEVTFTAPMGRPFGTGLQRFYARVPGANATGTAEIVPDEAAFLVISDFDDTVAVSNVTRRTGFLTAALLQDARTHPVVEGMPALYRCLQQDKEVMPGFAFVSGSPQQFGIRMQGFFQKHGFPFGGVYLRNLGPSTLSRYKQPVLRRLLSTFPQRVIFLGDNGEHDPEVYAEMKKEFPDRVLAIYIRDVGGSGGAARVDGLLFKEPIEVARDARARGFLSDSCFDRAFGSGQVGAPTPPGTPTAR